VLDKNPLEPRKEVASRYYRTFTYQDVDRVPDIEFGYWPQTLRRWLGEGMDLDLEPRETANMFSAKVDGFFGFDRLGHGGLGVRTDMNPRFEEEVIERREKSVVMRDSSGIVAERFLHDSDESSIPHYLEFPVKTPDDWAAMKERFRPDDPTRGIPAEDIDRVRQAAAEGKMITLSFCGPYAQLRWLMGFENLSLAFYQYPEMVHDMAETWTGLCVGQMRQVPEDCPVDEVSWWEDMAGKAGPFVGPKTFREFLQPCYRAVMVEAKKRGCAIGVVDSDGNPHDIVANWLEEGVNIMFPLEVTAGVDPFAWREEFGTELRLRGGIAKEPLVRGGSAIDAELERIRPLLDQGGFIPHLDHLVPPDISYKNYCEYLEKKRKLIGKA